MRSNPVRGEIQGSISSKGPPTLSLIIENTQFYGVGKNSLRLDTYPLNP